MVDHAQAGSGRSEIPRGQ